MKIKDMIKELETKGIEDRYGNCYGVSYPSDYQIFEKVNELVNKINEINKRLDKLEERL